LCIRALACGDGHGVAIERVLTYLAQLQKSEGIWPKVPFRRMPGDAFVSAFVLFELGDLEGFRRTSRVTDAIDWFHGNVATLDPDTRRMWDRAAAKQTRRARNADAVGLWS